MKTVLSALVLCVIAVTANAGTPTATELGLGTADPSPHQVVRTSGNRLYVFSQGCPSYPTCGPNAIHVYRADQTGIATSFTEVGQTGAPAGNFVGSISAAIDARDVVTLIYNRSDGAGEVRVVSFLTATNRWAGDRRLQTTHWTEYTQGEEGVALAVDATGTAHAVWVSRGAATAGPTRLFYARRGASGWSRPARIDDQAVPLGTRQSLHPAIAFDTAGRLTVAWLQGSRDRDLGQILGFSFPIYYTADGTIFTRTMSAAGTWGPTARLPGIAMTAIDNGPSLISTPDGTLHLTFISGEPGQEDEMRYYYDRRDGAGWRGDRQPDRFITHDPALGPDGAGGVVIYTHGQPGYYAANQRYQFLSYGNDEYYFTLPSGAAAWSAPKLYAAGPFDSAPSTRWSQFLHNFPQYLDVLFWRTDRPNAMIGQATAPLP